MDDVQIVKDIVRFSDDLEYYADNTYITNSMLSKLNKGPEHLQHYLCGGVEESPALNFGKAFHLYVLENDRFKEEVAIFSGKTRRGKDWDVFSELHGDKVIISSKEYSKIMSMYSSLMSKEPIKKWILDDCNTYEEVAIGHIGHTACKGKADMVWRSKHSEEVKVIDLKTTQSVNPKDFKRSCYKYGYHRQAYFYSELFNANEFMFICVEKEPPYSVGLFYASDEFIDNGRAEVHNLLGEYENYFADALGKEMLKSYFVKEEL